MEASVPLLRHGCCLPRVVDAVKLTRMVTKSQYATVCGDITRMIDRDRGEKRLTRTRAFASLDLSFVWQKLKVNCSAHSELCCRR